MAQKENPMRWTQSIAVKSFAVAFVATHIPLLVLVAVAAVCPAVAAWAVERRDLRAG